MSSIPPGQTTGQAAGGETVEQRRARQANQSVVNRFAEKYHMVVDKVLPVLRATAFKQVASRGQEPAEVTDDQMYALLVVAEQYNLNPFTREIYAYPDKQKGITPVVSVDGWVRIVQEHPKFAGFEIRYGALIQTPYGKPGFESIGFQFFRNDDKTTDFFDEYLDECYRAPYTGRGQNGEYTIEGPWQTHARRMLRHKAFIQSARMTFGFAGIYDDDEAERIIEGQYAERAAAPPPASRTEAAKQALQPRTAIENKPAPVANFQAPAQGEPERVNAPAGERQQPKTRGDEWDMPAAFTDPAPAAARQTAQEAAAAAQAEKPASPTPDGAKVPPAQPVAAAKPAPAPSQAPVRTGPPTQDQVRKLLVEGKPVFLTDEAIRDYLNQAKSKSEARLLFDDVVDDAITQDREISMEIEAFNRELKARLP